MQDRIDELADYYAACNEDSEEECASSFELKEANNADEGLMKTESAGGVATFTATPLTLQHVHGASQSQSGIEYRGKTARAAALFLSSQPFSVGSFELQKKPLRELSQQQQAVSPETEYLVDALSAVRQLRSSSFDFQSTKSSSGAGWKNGRWVLKKDTAKRLVESGLITFGCALTPILQVATDISELKSGVEQFRKVTGTVLQVPCLERLCCCSLTDIPYGGTEALGCVALACFSRFHVVVEEWLDDYLGWVVELVEVLTGNAGKRSAASVPPVPPLDTGAWSQCLPSSQSPASIVGPPELALTVSKLSAVLELNAAPLRSLLVVLHETDCFSRLLAIANSCASDPRSDASASRFAIRVAREAAMLLDVLVVRAGSLQDTSTLNLYRAYMMVILHCSWPYLELSTAAIFGCVRDIDFQVWRELLPRMFKTSFSHLKGSTEESDSPTDIFSLILNCIDFHKGSVLHQANFSSNKASALLIARRFIIRSFGVFARRKGRERQMVLMKKLGVTTNESREEFLTTVPLGSLTLQDEDIVKKNCFWSARVTEAPCDIFLSKDLNFAQGDSCQRADMWINVSIPAARWITAAVLLPFGEVVQRLHKQRLSNLYRAYAPHYTLTELEYPEGVVIEHSTTAEEDPDGREADSHAGPQQHPVLPLGEADQISFASAMRLLMTVALVNSRDRIVDSFLSRLYASGKWWDSSSAAQRAVEISALFKEALRGLPHAELVELNVLPTVQLNSQNTSSGQCAILNAFASFELRFSLPDELMVVLLPRVLSLHEIHETGQMKSTYSTLFWHHRRGSAKKQQTHLSPHILSSLGSRISFSDVWSYVFGYICSLHYTQMALREQRKVLQLADARTHFTRKSDDSEKDSVQLLSRGIGSTFYCLSFIVDTLLSFTLHEVHQVVFEFEEAFCSNSNTFNSACELCQALDQLLLRMRIICFPSLPPSCTSKEDVMAFSSSSETVRESITELLSLALDPTRFSISLVSLRTKRTVEALVAVISSTTVHFALHARLKPLLTMLTFNHYYGDDEREWYRFR